MSKMGRPAIPESQRKVRESVYFDPEVHAWLKDKADKRDASLSSLLNVIVKDRMKKESSK